MFFLQNKNPGEPGLFCVDGGGWNLCVAGSVRRLSIPEVGIFIVGNSATWDTGADIDSPAELLSLMSPRERHSIKLHERCRRGFFFDFYKFNGLRRGLDNLIKGNIGLLITPHAH